MKNATLVLADNVRRLMAYRGLSQGKLAELARISQRAVGYLVNYRDGEDRHPTTPTIEAIASAFGLEAWQLMVPDFNLELLGNPVRMRTHMANYMHIQDTGRAHVEHVSENEARYAIADDVIREKRQSHM